MISEQCDILKISRSGYYRWKDAQHRDPRTTASADAEREMALVKAVLDAYLEHSVFGYRKMSHFLLKQGIDDATEKRVRLLYKRLGLRGASQKFKIPRPPKGKFQKYPYLLRNKPILFVNQVWATDIIYIKLPHGMVYLVAIIDLYSRKILSWRLSDTMKADFCIDALYEAIENYGVPAIFNTDCGSQFTSDDFTGVLEASMFPQ